MGDANLDGTVNGVDSGIVAVNFNKSVTGWDEGDFNYDGIVNGIDEGLLAANFNKGNSPFPNLTLDYGSSYDPVQTIISYASAADNGASAYRVTSTFSYDNNGNLIGAVDADGRSTSYTYDGFNRQTQEEWHDNSSGALVGGINSAYDGDGRLLGTAETDGTGTLAPYSMEAYTYDNLGDKIESLTITPNQSTDVRQAYDNAGELLDQANWFNISFSPTLTFTYNSSGLLQALSGVPQVYKATMDTVEQFTYNNDGTTASEILLGWSEVAQSPYTLYGWATLNMNNAGPGPAVTPLSVSFGYNNDAQLTAIYRADESVNSTVTNAWTAGPTTTYSYTTGLLSSEITSEGGSNLVSYSYSTYDTDNQLKNAKFSDSTNTTVSFAYTYTPDNQLATENDTGTYAGSSYTYSTGNSYDNNGNRTGSGISTGANNEIGTQGSMAYLYDNNGNRLLAAQMSGITLTAYNDYNFDPRNRLSNVIAPWVSQSVNYTYDPSNRRIEEQDVNTTTTTYTEFAYDPGGSLVMELNKGATSVTATFLPDRVGGVAALASEDASGNVNWNLTNQVGSVQDEVNNSGVFSDRVLFNAEGQKTEADSGTASIYGFQGEQQPVSSTPSGILALDRNGVSWTDPALQNAFISPDPKGFAAGTNAYERDGNNPVNNTDPSGLEFQTGTSVQPVNYSIPVGPIAPLSADMFPAPYAPPAATQPWYPSLPAETNNLASNVSVTDQATNSNAYWNAQIAQNEAEYQATTGARVAALGAQVAEDQANNAIIQRDIALENQLDQIKLTGSPGAGYSSEKYQYTPPALEQSIYGGVGLGSLLTPRAMDLADTARPVITAGADIGSFIPGVNFFAAPAAIALNSANSYANGDSTTSIGVNAGVQLATWYGPQAVAGIGNLFGGGGTLGAGGFPVIGGLGGEFEPGADLGMQVRGPNLGQTQGREFRLDQLQTYQYDPNAPSYVRGWLQNEERRIALGQAVTPRTPPGYVLAHGRLTPAREGFDYSNARLQGADLNILEESVRRAMGAP